VLTSLFSAQKTKDPFALTNGHTMYRVSGIGGDLLWHGLLRNGCAWMIFYSNS